MNSLLCSLLLLTSALYASADSHHHKRAAAVGAVFDGYYAGYNQFVTPPSAVNYKDYTHLSFFVGESMNGYDINLNTTLNADAVIKDTVKRAKAAKVKSVLVIGGWSGSRYFSNLFATATRRTNYAKSLQKLIKLYSFDGIEIDWEWPGSAGIGNNQNSPADSANFLLFLNQLRATLGTAPLITISVAASGLKDAKGATITDYSAWLKAVDYFKLMDYDMNGPWNTITAPTAPLVQCYSEAAKMSVTASVELYKKAKVPGSKIILIVPGFGVSYSTKYSALKKVKTSTGRDSQAFQPLFNQNPQVGNVTWSGLIGQGLLNRDGTAILPYKRYWDACTSTPFLWNSKLTSLVTYDDPTSIAAKAAFAKSQGLAGISLFEISQDLQGDLIKAAKAAFISGKAKRDLGDRLEL